jgi:hypothetical protein
MKYPFRAAASVFTTGVVSWLLSNLLPWFWGFGGFDRGSWYGFPLHVILGYDVPVIGVVLAAFFVVYGLFTRNAELNTTMVFLSEPGYDDEPEMGSRWTEPEDRETPRLDATVNGPDLDGL